MLIDELKAFRDQWRQYAVDAVPDAYASRGMYDKYLKGDYHAAGMNDCADELDDLIQRYEGYAVVPREATARKVGATDRKQITPGRSYPFGEWCELRGFSRTTGWRLMRDGEIQTYKVRGNRYVTEAADRAFIERKESEAG